MKKKIRKKGIHILADFYQCQCPIKNLTKKTLIKRKLEESVKRNGLNLLRSTFYSFCKNGGVTGMVLLSESHVALHTWPEKNYLTLDIFVCNYTENNTLKAHYVYKDLYKFFEPKKVIKKILYRE